MERVEHLLTILTLSMTGVKLHELPWRSSGIDEFLREVRGG
jgi:hypothetical protein